MMNLKELCKNNEIFFWNDANGEICMPGDRKSKPTDGFLEMVVHESSELPPKVKELYEKFRENSEREDIFVVNIKGEVGILVLALLDFCYVNDELSPIVPDSHSGLPRKSEGNLMTNEEAFMMLYGYVAGFEKSLPIFKNADKSGPFMVLGKDTDADGHEYGIFIPYKNCDRVEACIEAFDNLVF